MKNREKFAKEIMDIACSGSCIAMDKETNRIIPCFGLDCDNCEFANNNNCREEVVKWCESEYEEPKITIPADTPVDTKILVSNNGEDWLRRYFAGFDGDLVLAWFSGTTSWSNENGKLPWEYGKLAEEE